MLAPRKLVPLCALLAALNLTVLAQTATEASSVQQATPASSIGKAAASALQSAAAAPSAPQTNAQPASAPQAAEPAQTQAELQTSAPLRVMVGKSLLVSTTDRLRRVSVTDPTVADAMVVTPTQVLVHGRAPGEVSLILWDDHA
jgi:pilus assembly protein CpaC